MADSANFVLPSFMCIEIFASLIYVQLDFHIALQILLANFLYLTVSKRYKNVKTHTIVSVSLYSWPLEPLTKTVELLLL